MNSAYARSVGYAFINFEDVSSVIISTLSWFLLTLTQPWFIIDVSYNQWQFRWRLLTFSVVREC